ncbi:MAG: hypothetical protein ACRD8W_01675 [Nitrososphaeraceae archaeon]
MNYKQIASEVRISVRDIKPILDKYGVDNLSGYTSNNGKEGDSESLMSISSRAYKLFAEEFMTPVEVAIALNLEAPEAMRYYDEFLQMNNRGTLVKLFKEIGNEGILWLVQLCAVARTSKISVSKVIEFVSIYCNDLFMVKRQCKDAECELQAILTQTYQSEIKLEFLNSKLEKVDKDLGSKQMKCEEVDKERRKLVGQTLRLRRFISEFKNNNITYEKIEQFVEEKANSILRDNMQLLRLGLISLLRSLGKDEAYKYRYLLHELNLVEIPGSIDGIESNYMPITNPIQSGSDAIVVRNSPKATGIIDRYQHSNRQKKDGHCPACFQSSILAMSNEYFENLKQLITDEVMSTLIEDKAHFSSRTGVS